MKFQGILRHLNTDTADMMIQPDVIVKFSSVVNDLGIDTQLTSYCITQLNSADPASYTRWFRSITKSLTPQTDPQIHLQSVNGIITAMYLLALVINQRR